MSFELGTAVAGIVFGLALAVPPGPMNAVIAEESVTRGWAAGFAAGLGAMLADVVFFVLVLVGAIAVFDVFEQLETALFLIGGLLMLLFAADALSTTLRSATFTEAEVAVSATGFQKALALGLTNPYQIAFWLTIGISLVRSGRIDLAGYVPLASEFVVTTGSASLIGGFFLGIVIWIVGYPAALVAIGDRFDAFAPVVAAASGLVLLGFGLLFIWLGLDPLL
ncbi:MAG: LysE family transporter [Halobacteriota archaeon]